MKRLGLVLVGLLMLGSLLAAPTASHAGKIIFENNHKTYCFYYIITTHLLGLDLLDYRLLKPRTRALYDDLVGTIDKIIYSSCPATRCGKVSSGSTFTIWRNTKGPSITRSFFIHSSESGNVHVQIIRN